MNLVPGKTEFDIFKNYYTTQKEEETRLYVNGLSLESKDDAVSEECRGLVKQYFIAKEYYLCLEKYTDCLRFATCNGREYAMALANRSATYFVMNSYENCLKDIDLCLQAEYPSNLKPKILIRKVKCLIKMGNFQEMIVTINDFAKAMQDNPNLPKIDKDNYLKEIKSLMENKQIDIEELPFKETSLPLEVIRDKNRLNPNVSASIKLKYNKNEGMDYIAARDIPRGEVLFLDKAYATSFIESWKNEDDNGLFFCNYCCRDAQNCIPCKVCIDTSYCSENCRDNAWTDYHQWECDMLRINPKYITGQLCLTLRTLIKAARSGEIFQISNNAKLFKPSTAMDSYLHIYSLPVNLANIRSKYADAFGSSCEMAVIMVEFLKRTNFFTNLMTTSSCRKDYPTLVNFIGGLFFRHNVQMIEGMITRNVTSSILLVNQKELKLEFKKSMMFCAFCPTVSGLKYSCKSNTSMYFNEDICIVKACENISAGNRIFRSGYNCTPMQSMLVRKEHLQRLYLNCNCKACEDISYNIDILNTFRCIHCDGFTIHPFVSSTCNNCKCITDIKAIISTIQFVEICKLAKEQINNIQYLEKMMTSLNVLKKSVNPDHHCLYDIYAELLSLYSNQDNINEFKKALQNFKTCAKNRSGRFDSYTYMIDLTIICKACFAYLQHNKSILQKQEITEILTYWSDVVNEAKEIAEFTFPPLLGLIAQIEFYILKFRVSQLALQE